MAHAMKEPQRVPGELTRRVSSARQTAGLGGLGGFLGALCVVSPPGGTHVRLIARWELACVQGAGRATPSISARAQCIAEP